MIALSEILNVANSELQKVGENRYRISEWVAPQRYARNIIELIPDAKIPMVETTWLLIE